MIAKSGGTGSGFKGLARYLEYGSLGDEHERCDFVEFRNLGTHDTTAAVRIMRATANQSGRCENPVYHYSIAWDKGDPFTFEMAVKAVDQTLDQFGLREHQSMVFSHRDTAHKHIHVMVNRVHPERGKAWHNGKDFKRLEKALRIFEREHGLREVAGNHYQLDGQQRPGFSRLSDGEKREKERTGQTFKDQIHDRAERLQHRKGEGCA